MGLLYPFSPFPTAIIQRRVSSRIYDYEFSAGALASLSFIPFSLPSSRFPLILLLLGLCLARDSIWIDLDPWISHSSVNTCTGSQTD